MGAEGSGIGGAICLTPWVGWGGKWREATAATRSRYTVFVAMRVSGRLSRQSDLYACSVKQTPWDAQFLSASLGSRAIRSAAAARHRSMSTSKTGIARSTSTPMSGSARESGKRMTL